jgi:hypothetical protein
MNKLNNAINIILQNLGEQTLGATEAIDGIFEAEQASLVIDEIKTQVLAFGYNFNTDKVWEFVPDMDGYIAIPDNALSVDPTDTGQDYVVKDHKLYNKDDVTYVFTSTVEAEVIWDVPFDDVPLIVQHYIVTRASRMLVQRLTGNETMLQYLLNDEEKAKVEVLNWDSDIGDYNVFDSSTTMRIINRTTNPRGLKG